MFFSVGVYGSNTFVLASSVSAPMLQITSPRGFPASAMTRRTTSDEPATTSSTLMPVSLVNCVVSTSAKLCGAAV